MDKIGFILKSAVDLIVFYFYKIYFSLKRKKMSDTWLISERGIDARDNGYWFYKYMVNNHPEVNVKYVISKDSADYGKINKKDVVLYRSKEHYYYFLYSKYLISAEIMGFSPNEQLFYRLVKHQIVKLPGKKIFLQHGITKDYKDYLAPQNTKLDMFVCGAIPEQEFMIKEYGYTKKEAVLTGFARFDNLKDESERIILIMPTWRKWLKYSDNLFDTDFYKNYMKLLNDEEVIKLLVANGYKLVFYPHIVFQKFLKDFKSTSNEVIMASFEEYDVQDLLKRASLLITDYSSVAFDFAYMNKNVVYYQFDYEKFKQLYQKEYFDYEKDGFGPVCHDFEAIKSELIKYINDDRCFEKYEKRISAFFKEKDQKNCERIYREIENL